MYNFEKEFTAISDEIAAAHLQMEKDHIAFDKKYEQVCNEINECHHTVLDTRIPGHVDESVLRSQLLDHDTNVRLQQESVLRDVHHQLQLQSDMMHMHMHHNL